MFFEYKVRGSSVAGLVIYLNSLSEKQVITHNLKCKYSHTNWNAVAWLQRLRVISVMNAALFVGQSVANMRLPPCLHKLMLTILNRMIASGLHTHTHKNTQWISWYFAVQLQPYTIVCEIFLVDSCAQASICFYGNTCKFVVTCGHMFHHGYLIQEQHVWKQFVPLPLLALLITFS